MNEDYRALTMRQAVDGGAQGVNESGYRWEHDVGIWRCEDGRPVELIAADGVADDGGLVEAGGHDCEWWAERLNEAHGLGGC